MKTLYKTFLIFLCFSLTAFVIWERDSFVLAENKDFSDEIISLPVIAKINQDCDIFFDMELKNVIKNIKKGVNVEIFKDRGTKVYLVKNDEYKVKGWLKGEFLDIPDDPEVNTNYLKESTVEKFINDKGISSNTKYLIFTNIDRQLTYILEGKTGNWKVIKTIKCATGRNISPTTKGLFKITDRGQWFYSDRLGSGAKYWLRFNGSYLFHSVAMDKNKNVIDNVVGKRRSSGCVRMLIEDIKWVYENIPYETTVFIN